MSHWGVRNQSETSQKPAKRNLSLSLAYSLTLLPEILRLLLFQFPLPLLLLLLLVLLVLLWVFRTVSGPRKLILLPSLKQCVHAWILTLITRLATTLSTTTTPAATAPPLPLVHLGISAFAFKSNWHESRWRVRNPSETGHYYYYYYYYYCYYYYSYSYSSSYYWYYCEFSGPRNFLFFSNMKTNAFMGRSFY